MRSTPDELLAGTEQDVDVAARSLSPAVGSGNRDGAAGANGRDRVLDVARQSLHLVARYSLLELLVKPQTHVLIRAELSRLSCRQRSKLRDGGDAVLPVELPRRLRAYAPHPGELQYGLDVRFASQLLELRELTRREKLADLISHRGRFLRKRGSHRRVAQLFHIRHDEIQPLHRARHLLVVPRLVRVRAPQDVLVYRRQFLQRTGDVGVQVDGSRGGRALAREGASFLSQPRAHQTVGARSRVDDDVPLRRVLRRRRRTEAHGRRDGRQGRGAQAGRRVHAAGERRRVLILGPQLARADARLRPVGRYQPRRGVPVPVRRRRGQHVRHARIVHVPRDGSASLGDPVSEDAPAGLAHLGREIRHHG